MTDFSNLLKNIGKEVIKTNAPVSSTVTAIQNADVSPTPGKASVLGPADPAAVQASRESIFADADWRKDAYRVDKIKRIPRPTVDRAVDAFYDYGAGGSAGAAGLVSLGLSAKEFAYEQTSGYANLSPEEKEDRRLKHLKNKAAVASFADSQQASARVSVSNQLQNSKTILQDETREDFAKNAADFAASEQTFSDKLARIGKDALVQARGLSTNPQAAGSTVANAGGSLVPSLLASGGTSYLAQGGLKLAGAGAKTTAVGTTATTAATVGAVEGAGAYNSTVSKVNKMTHEQLMAGSEEYNRLIATGTPLEDAKAYVADMAGARAQKEQTAIASGIGLVPGLSKFDANPLKNIGFRGLVGETAEEAIQSATGEISGNRGIKAFADKNADTTAGVGAALVEGALGGFGATGTVQSPGLAADSAGLAGKATLKSGGFMVNQVAKIGAERRRVKADLANPTGEANTTQSIENLETLLNTELDAETATPEQIQLSDKLPRQFMDTSSDTYVEQVSALPKEAQSDVVEGSRFQTVRKMAKRLSEDFYPEEGRAAVAEFIVSEIAQIREYVNQNRTEEKEPATNEDVIARSMNDIISNKTFANGEEAANVILTPAVEADTVETNAPATIKEAVTDPVGLDPVRATEALKSGDYTPAETSALRIAETVNAPKTDDSAAGRSQTRDELLFSGSNKGYGKVPSFNQLVSTAVKGAIKASRGGNTEITETGQEPVNTQDVVVRLKNLAQHQINKYEAVTESKTLQETDPEAQVSKVKYDTLDPRTGDTFFSGNRGNEAFFDANNPESVETYKQIREDANVGITAYNKILEEFPEVYSGKPLPLIPTPEVKDNGDTNTAVSNADTQRSGRSAPEAQGQTTDTKGVGQDRQADIPTSSDTGGDSSSSVASDRDNGPELDIVIDTAEAVKLGPKEREALIERIKNRNPLNFELATDRAHKASDVVELLENSNPTPNEKPMIALIKRNLDRLADLEILNQTGTPKGDIAFLGGTEGFFAPAQQGLDKPTLFLNNSNREILIHELIHAISLSELQDKMKSAESKAEEQLNEKEAAARAIESMMEDFMTNPSSQEGKALELYNVITTILRAGNDVDNRALAVNEFMAWSLANNILINQNRTRKLGSIAKKVLSNLKTLLGLSQDSTVLDALILSTNTLLGSNSQKQFPGSPKLNQKLNKEDSTNNDKAAAGSESSRRTADRSEATRATGTEQETASPQRARSANVLSGETVAPSATGSTGKTLSDELSASEAGARAVGSNLVKDSSGVSVFNETYSVDPVITMEDDIIDMANSESAAEALDYVFTPEMETSLKTLLSQLGTISEGINAKLQKDIKNKKYNKDTDYQQLLTENNAGNTDSKDVQRIRGGRVLALIDAQSLEEGAPRYDDLLMNIALLATLDYIMNTPASGNTYKEADIISALGLPAGTQVTADMWDVVNFGRSATDTKEALARHIKSFWGASENTSVSESQTKGIAEAVADEILDYLQENDTWIEKQSLTLNNKTYASFKTKPVGADMGSGKSIVRDLLVPETSDVHQYSIGTKFPKSSLATTLKKDKGLILSKEKVEAIEAQQNTEFRMSKGFAEMFDFFGVDTFAEILGFTEFKDTDSYNANHLKALEGKNASIKTSINGVFEQMQRIRDYAEAKGTDANDTPIHYRLEVSLNGRFFMQGFNPQSNKLAREMFSPNGTEIDITPAGNGLSSDVKVMYAAVAQAMDEIKIENTGIEGAAEWAISAADGKFRKAIDAIKNREASGKEAASVDLINALAGKDIERSARLLKALYTVAQYENAVAAGEGSLKIDLPIELDGKTNGPISSAIQNNLGEFSSAFLSMVRRGGFFIGGDIAPENYAEFHKTEDSADLYEAVGDLKSQVMAKFNSDLRKGAYTKNGDKKSVDTLAEAQLLALELLSDLGDVRFKRSTTEVNEKGETVRVPGELVVKRGGTKGPITQQLYGAGEKSIAGGLTNAIFKMIYEEISTAVQNKDGERLVRLAAIVDQLSAKEIRKDFKSGELKAWEGKNSKGLEDALSSKKALLAFTFDQKAFDNISQALEQLYVPAFTSALGQTVGSTVANLNETLVEATNNHANIYTSLVNQALETETLKQRDAGTIGKGDQLSKKDRNKIIAEHRKYAPIIDVGSSVFNLSTGNQETSTDVDARRAEQKKDGKRVESTFPARSETLSGKKSGSKRDSFSDAGVRILPYNVIANADVAMITETFIDPEMDTQALAVHDGVETTLTSIDKVSKVMNRAVFKSWQTNTIDPVLQSLKGLQSLASELEKLGVEQDALSDLVAHINTLETASVTRQAKIDALATVAMTVDGVPGAQAPFSTETGLTFENETELLEHLNREFQSNLDAGRAKLRAEAAAPLQERIEIEPKEGSDLRKALGDDFNGDVNTFIEAVEKLVTNPDQAAVLQEIKASPALQDIKDAGLKVVVEERAENGGSYDMDSNTLYISNVTPETAIHELVHAATAHQVMEHYLAPESQSDRGKAMERLESLMNDFVSRDYDSNTVEALLKTEIQEALASGGVNGQVQALNEFMAWSLSNESLINNNKEKLALDAKSGPRALGKKAIAMMRRILGFVSNKTFDHILFNTSIILNADQTTAKNLDGINKAIFNQRLRSQEEISEDATRQERLQEMFDQQLSAFLEQRKIRRAADGVVTPENIIEAAQMKSEEAYNRVVAAGFKVSNKRLFKSMAAMFSMDLQNNKIARLEAQRMFDAVIDKLSPEVFLEQMGTNQIDATQQQRIDAEALHAAAVGLMFEDPGNLNSMLGPVKDVFGNSDKLGVFLALSQTNDLMRDILADYNFDSLGIKPEIQSGSLDDLINNITRFSLQNVTSLALRGTREGSKDVTAQEAMDVLAELLTVFDLEQASTVENKASGFAGKANKKAKATVEKTAEKVADKASDAAETLKNSKGLSSLAGILLSTVSTLANLFSQARASAQADGLTSALNNSKVPHAVREVFSEVRGMTGSTTDVYKLVKLAKQKVSSIREEYRSSVPKILANAFSEDFNSATLGQSRKAFKARVAQDWQFMYKGFGRADLTAAIFTLGQKRALLMFGNNQETVARRGKARKDVQKRIAKNVKSLSLSPVLEAKVIAAYNAKAAQLGSHLATGETGSNLLRSAEAIAGLYNEGGYTLTEAESTAYHKAVSDQRIEKDNGVYRNSGGFKELIQNIDTLATIEAIDKLDKATHGRLQELIKDELQGVQYALSYMKDLRAAEAKKTDHRGANINGYKGFMPSDSKRRYKVIIADNKDHDDLVRMGYTRVRDYKGARQSLNKTSAPQGYYFSTSAGLANFNQGALQTVQQSFNGVDPSTGLTQDSSTSGTVSGDAAKNLNRKIKRKKFVSADNMLPVFSEYGDLIGFEAALAPDIQKLIEPQEHLAESLGNWAGRQIEEQAAEGFNQDLIDALHQNYEEREFGTDDQYVEFSDTSADLAKDKVWQDNWRLIPKETKAYAEKKFGGPLMVRRDMINNALGYRSASIGDVFTGQTRMNEDVRTLMRDALISVPFLGNNAYKYLTAAEGAVQTIVSEVKHTIVVKSGIIMAANELSNNVQLLGREVPVSYIIKKKRTKYAELSQYVKNQSKKVELRADKLAANNKSAKQKIQNRIDAIEESERRMSIWPLLQSGEYTTISDGLTSQDTDLINGNFVDAIEEAIANLPGPFSTVGRYAIVSKDTALYKLLAKGVQYSDFTSKAIYYDFITENKGFSQEDALNKVTEEFINYDLADGRTRNYAESLGMTWFLNFKIRAIKVALDIIRNNPLTALFTLGGAGAMGMDVGSAVTDNAAAATADGRIGYSVGPGMTRAAWSLNIWKQIFG